MKKSWSRSLGLDPFTESVLHSTSLISKVPFAGNVSATIVEVGTGAEVSRGAWAFLELDVKSVHQTMEAKAAAVDHKIESFVEPRYRLLMIELEVAFVVDGSIISTAIVAVRNGPKHSTGTTASHGLGIIPLLY